MNRGSATRVVDECDGAAYYRTRRSLLNSPVPVYSVPGNNDWPECADPAEGWRYYQRYMMGLDRNWNATAAADYYDVARQDRREENFAFLHERVLFVGLHMVTNSDADETRARLEDNLDWVEANVDRHWNDVDVVFLMGYGRLLARDNEPFYDAVVARKRTEWTDKLVVYARRAGASYMAENVGGVEGLVELRVGNGWPIMDVRVRTEGPGTAVVDYRDVADADDDEDNDNNNDNDSDSDGAVEEENEEEGEEV